MTPLIDFLGGQIVRKNQPIRVQNIQQNVSDFKSKLKIAILLTKFEIPTIWEFLYTSAV